LSSGFVDVVTPEARRAEYLATGLWDDTTLAGQVTSHAAARPGTVAVIDGTGRHTYAELARDAGSLAGALAERGVGEGVVVSVQLPNRYEAVVTAVAVQSRGGVINPLLPSYRRRELAHVFRTAMPTVIVTPGEYRGFDHQALVAEVVASTGVDVHPSSSTPCRTRAPAASKNWLAVPLTRSTPGAPTPSAS
jgi:non-ribosomal peptide synthetase component E (peptide arylation enzyme)